MKYILYTLLLVVGFANAQQSEVVDFLKIEAALQIKPQSKLVKGEVTVRFQMKTTADSIYLDGKNMSVTPANKSPLRVSLSAENEKIWLRHHFKAGKKYTVVFDYKVNPTQTMYFLGWDDPGTNQVWTQGQGKYTSYWLPSIDDLTDKIEFDLSYTFPKNYELTTNGKLVSKRTKGNFTTWKFDMKHLMSSYLVAMAAGEYQYRELTSKSGIPLKLYYEPKDSAKVEPTYRHAKKIFDFLEEEIGVPFPWQDYKQVPVRDFLYAGMENTTLTIFSDAFMTDSIGFVDRNYLNVNAHELAHQWFGNMVTESSSESHWLQEGFATYYALLVEREVFGSDYYDHKLYETAEQLKQRSDNGKGEALNNPKASSLTFYEKGAWALHILREKVGDEAFRTGIQHYLKKYKFQNVTNAEFFAEMESASGMDLSEFEDDWVKQAAFQANEALSSLKKSEFMQNYLQVAALRKIPLEDKMEELEAALAFPVNEYIGQEVVSQLAKELPSRVLPLYQKAFATNNVFVRQAIAVTLKDIPKELQSDYETLLQDESYLTIEEALFNLWRNFPQKRKQYLDETKGVVGFENHNVEMEWLTLNLVTQDYEPERKSEVYKKLSGYTSPQYGYGIRENAFGYLFQIDSFSAQNYKDLLQGCAHPVWRFKNFCRKLLTELISDENHKKELLSMKMQFTPSQQTYLLKQLQ